MHVSRLCLKNYHPTRLVLNIEPWQEAGEQSLRNQFSGSLWFHSTTSLQYFLHLGSHRRIGGLSLSLPVLLPPAVIDHCQAREHLHVRKGHAVKLC